LELGAHVEGVAEVRGALELPAKDEARIAFEGPPVGPVDVAEHAGDPLLAGPPGHELERRGVRLGEHVRLVDTSEPFDARAVEAHSLFDRLLEVLDRDGEALERTDDVGEPEANELDIVLAASGENVGRGFRGHRSSQVIATAPDRTAGSGAQTRKA